MTQAEIEAKFNENAETFLPSEKAGTVRAIVANLETLDVIGSLVDFCVA